ncbi:ankyrin repeat and SOCS box protein 18 [Carassius auratus]|uniref:Ankyrin repeat and SOCS box protein 18-like n=1 Tax=Carassius auratus TaxID=7957 RepID=A0A6P6Q2M8_CARAU|nr:ankyrin repeat and SOCS box protein 18-like [Carassius auratus]XP_026127725.1 ankyrin repeat and SOCS box protein 18-like [Carassius auratus]
MLSQGSGACVVSRKATFLKERRRSSLDSRQGVRKEKSKGYKQPGIDFLCPPVLNDLLSHHWRDMQDGFSDPEQLNKVLEFQSDELLWTAQKLGLWSLEYKRELTSPLCIAAAQGFSECLQYLLEHGARPNLIAGGKAALHEACANANTECVELLLEHGANPNQMTDEGLTALHLCRTPQSLRCAKTLVRYGARVNSPSEEEDETPLHVAARHGLPHHAQLYLRFGACVNHSSSSGETPLGVVCGVAPEKTDDSQDERYLEICRLLLAYGAKVNLSDKERRSPLHKAARNVQLKLVELLLEHGADINAIDYNGCSPLSSVLQSSVVRQEWEPHRVVQTLINRGSIKVWPLALLKVLTACAAAPKTVEILFNSYTLVPVTYKWVEAIPEDIFHLHKTFYESLFALEYKPRSLQHLCRSALRNQFGKKLLLTHSQAPLTKAT